MAVGFALSVIPLPAQTPATGGQKTPPETPPHVPRFVVVLDAAHGGEENGGQVGAAVAEKTVTLALSVQLRSLLTARGFQVVTTREGNVSLDNNARAQIANHASAAACLSFHATQTGSGVHIFVSSLAPSDATGVGRFLAWKSAQAAFVTRSLKLASAINGAFQTGSDTGPIAANLGRTSLPGLDSMACPAVVLEVAPVRSGDGGVVTEVTDAQYQTQIVEAVAAALMAWRTDSEAEGTHSDLKPAGAGQP